jgi:archaellum component FlaF (FlaF/FlaG flagellin family)
VTLGFAEVALKEAQKRMFDVLLEGKVVHADYEPKKLKVENLTFEVVVEDGVLDIEFVTKTFNSKISAIAIEALR